MRRVTGVFCVFHVAGILRSLALQLNGPTDEAVAAVATGAGTSKAPKVSVKTAIETLLQIAPMVQVCQGFGVFVSFRVILAKV
jgi:hypothetical protein